MTKNIIIGMLTILILASIAFGPRVIGDSKPTFADSTQIENLQLKGGTIKLISALVLSVNDTAITNAFFKWREDYIDGNPPNDNANVTITIASTVSVAFFYKLLLNLPAGYTEEEDFLGDFKTSIAPKRVTNTYLDRLCDELEAEKTEGFLALKANGLKNLSAQ
jgi:hypothetical protein